MRHKPTYLVNHDTGCWEWQGATGKNGYGQTWDGKQVVYAHRFFYEQTKGVIPVGLDLDHLCRNRSCVNPDHLEPVSRAVNAQRGERATTTPEQVREIRALYGDESSRPTCKQLQERFGLGRGAVDHIIRCKTWREIA